MPGFKSIILSVLPLAVWFVLFSCGEQAPSFQCTDPLGCVRVEPGDPLKIGVLQALSGKVASLGMEQIRGLELAIDQKNGQVLGHSFLLQKEDTGCTSEGGANAVLKILADPQTIAIFGTTCSGAARTASHAMSEAGLVMISGNNSAPFLTSIGGKAAPDWHSGYFRTANNEENAGKAAAIFAFQKLGIRRVAMVNDTDIYTRGLTDGFRQSFEKQGGKIVLDTSINKGETVMGPVLTAVYNSGAQLLFFPLFQPEGNLILAAAAENPELRDIVMMSDGALIEDSFIRDVKEKGKGMYFVGPVSPKNPAADAVSRKYMEKYKTLPANYYFLNAYDAAMLLFGAIEAIAVQEADGSLYIGRSALRKALYATRDHKGVTGDLTCDEFGDCSKAAFNVLRLDDPDAGVRALQENVIFTYTPE
ncbi:MAG: branched-chain amino acid ABC transporter substrate-binding protein [Proteobacteria bacterium]|nr:branched-chain amino acid ABC transporter substrate-binding protein [Pseudomonadota bacterium]